VAGPQALQGGEGVRVAALVLQQRRLHAPHARGVVVQPQQPVRLGGVVEQREGRAVTAELGLELAAVVLHARETGDVVHRAGVPLGVVQERAGARDVALPPGEERRRAHAARGLAGQRGVQGELRGHPPVLADGVHPAELLVQAGALGRRPQARLGVQARPGGLQACQGLGGPAGLPIRRQRRDEGQRLRGPTPAQLEARQHAGVRGLQAQRAGALRGGLGLGGERGEGLRRGPQQEGVAPGFQGLGG
jgi:hypothetical protein